jgi:hypothetical protein
MRLVSQIARSSPGSARDGFLSNLMESKAMAGGKRGARQNGEGAMGLNKIETKSIDLKTLDVYAEASYALKTIEPSDNGLVMNTYLADQEGLNAFFRSYGEHGEFVVELKRVEAC